MRCVGLLVTRVVGWLPFCKQMWLLLSCKWY